MRKMRNVAILTTTVAVACVSVALAAVSAPASPAVSTGTATSINQTSVTLNGAVNPNGQQTSYAFQWGPTSNYGHETTLTSAGSGTSWQTVNAALSGLTPGTPYHFRLIALTATGGTVVGSDQTFATTGTAPAATPAPTATTGAATNVTQNAATVNGTVNPVGQSTTYYFEYGQTDNYGMETAALSAGTGVTDQQVSGSLSGLLPGTVYHFRLVAVSAGGTALGKDETLTTSARPIATTGSTSGVGTDSATVNGVVNPDGKSTTYYFQYGRSTSYGTDTGAAGAGAGTTNVAVHAYLGGLKPDTTYHYRVVATNADGTTYGNDAMFTTAGAVSSPSSSQLRVMGHMGFVSPGRVIGVEIGCFDGATTCSGHIAMTHDGQLIGQRDYAIAPNSGGFQNLAISRAGEQMLRGYNRVFHLLPVTITITPDSGPRFSYVLDLARWVWH